MQPTLLPTALALLAALLDRRAVAEVLTPPYFNLAEGRRITATATCGEGLQGPELYCKLVGANSERNVDYEGNLVIQGQVSARVGLDLRAGPPPPRHCSSNVHNVSFLSHPRRLVHGVRYKISGVFIFF